MSSKVDEIVYAAVAVLEDMTPDQRENIKTGNHGYDKLGALIKAVEASGLKPGDEVFTLLRRDAAAPDTIRFWAAKAESLARGMSNSPKCDAARTVAERWRMWQLDHLVETKVPD